MGTLLVVIKMIDGYSEGEVWRTKIKVNCLATQSAPSSASDQNIYENVNGDNNADDHIYESDSNDNSDDDEV